MDHRYTQIKQSFTHKTNPLTFYSTDSVQAHSEAYFEYPSVTAMMMRELRFGINIGLRTLTIRPWLASPHFSYAINNLQVRPHL